MTSATTTTTIPAAINYQIAVDATSTALQLIYLATSTAATGSAINI